MREDWELMQCIKQDLVLLLPILRIILLLLLLLRVMSPLLLAVLLLLLLLWSVLQCGRLSLHLPAALCSDLGCMCSPQMCGVCHDLLLLLRQQCLVAGCQLVQQCPVLLHLEVANGLEPHKRPQH
jgi:hypothetical protein